MLSSTAIEASWTHQYIRFTARMLNTRVWISSPGINQEWKPSTNSDYFMISRDRTIFTLWQLQDVRVALWLAKRDLTDIICVHFTTVPLRKAWNEFQNNLASPKLVFIYFRRRNKRRHFILLYGPPQPLLPE